LSNGSEAVVQKLLDECLENTGRSPHIVLETKLLVVGKLPLRFLAGAHELYEKLEDLADNRLFSAFEKYSYPLHRGKTRFCVLMPLTSLMEGSAMPRSAKLEVRARLSKKMPRTHAISIFERTVGHAVRLQFSQLFYAERLAELDELLAARPHGALRDELRAERFALVHACDRYIADAVDDVDEATHDPLLLEIAASR